MTLAAVKDPDDVVDYELSWATQLDGDTITSATWIVPAGIVKDSETNTTTVATVWLSGGTAGQQYQITCRVTTAGGRQMDRSIRIYVAEQ